MKNWTKRLLTVLVILGIGVTSLMIYAAGRTPPRRAPGEIRADLEARIDAYEAVRHPRPPLFLPASEGTATDHYREAFRLIDEAFDTADEETRVATNAALNEWEPWEQPPPAALRRFLPRAEKALAALRRGTCAEEPGRLAGIREEWVGLNIHEFALAKAMVLVEEGDARGALEMLLQIARLGADLRIGGPFASHGFGVTLQSRVLATLGRLLESGIFSSGERAEIRPHVGSWLGRPPKRVVVFDALFLDELQLYREWADEEPGNVMPAHDLLFTRRRIYRVLDVMWQAERATREAGNGNFSELGARMTRRAKSWVKWQVLSGAPIDALMLRGFWNVWKLSVAQIDEFVQREEARRSALLLTLDILDHQDENGRLPGSVEELGVDHPRLDLLEIRLDPAAGEAEIALPPRHEDDEREVLFRLPGR